MAGFMHLGIVTFGYPPLQHVSAKRPSYFARELARQGHAVSVVTVDWRSSTERRDRVEQPSPGTPGGICEVRVDPRLRFPGFDPTRLPRTTEPPFRGPLVLRRLRSAWRQFGWGPYPLWAREAFAALKSLHRVCRLDVVWAIHGDDSSHEIAYRFNKTAGVPWVADFKDPWDLFGRPIMRPLHQLRHRRRLSSAAAVTETCELQAAADAQRFGLRSIVIPSGFDDDLLRGAPPERPGEGFCISYFGHAGAQHPVERVASALVELGRQWPAVLARTRLHLFTSDGRVLQRALSQAGLGAKAVLRPWVPELRVFSLMKGSDVLLLLPATAWVPSGGSVGVKELEYLASGAPVLVLGALLPEVQRLVPHGAPVYEARTAEEAARVLSDLARGHRQPASGAGVEALRSHTWRTLGQRLEGVLRTAGTPPNA